MTVFQPCEGRDRLWVTSRASVLALLCSLVVPATILAQQGPQLRESFRVDAPLLVSKQFENISGLVEQADWARVLAAIENVEEEFADALVMVEPGRFLRASDYARQLLASLPEAGLTAYRQQIDGWAERQFARALNSRNERDLNLLLQEAYSSSYGDDALWMLGECQWERGDVQAARKTWEQLLPDESGEQGTASAHRVYPDAAHAPAEIRARLVLCSIAERQPRRAARELATFQELHPAAEGTLAGRSGRLADLLADILADSLNWPPVTNPDDWPTFARDHSRNAAMSTTVNLEGPQWMIPLDPLDVPNWDRDRPALPDAAPLGRYPVAVKDTLFFHDGVRIRAVRLADGNPKWPQGTDADVGDIYPPFNVLPLRPVLRPTVGVPRFTMTIHHGRLYALTGPSVLTLPDAGLRASPTRVVCLDVAEGQGLLRWFHTAEDLFPDGWTMTGTPIAVRDRLFLPVLKSNPALEPAVACLSTEDGRLLWHKSLGQALTEPLEGRVELGHQLLTTHAGRVYFSTDLGVVAALDLDEGHILWAATYESSPLAPLARSDERRNGLVPPLYDHGRLFVKPNDSEQFMAFDAVTGSLAWKQRLPGRVTHILGLQETHLIVGGDQLWAIDAQTGSVQWRFGSDDPSGFGYGQGTVCDERVFWTTREDLFVIDSHTGQARERYPLREILDVTGGHLLVAGNRLIIAGQDHLTAFEVSLPSR